MRWRTKLLAIAALAAFVFVGQPVRNALAAESELYVTLRYEVGDSVRHCWDEAEFRRSVARRVGYDPFRQDASTNVSIRVGGSSRVIDGRVEWRDAHGGVMGERRIVGKDGNCPKLLTEIGFAVGLQIRAPAPQDHLER